MQERSKVKASQRAACLRASRSVGGISALIGRFDWLARERWECAVEVEQGPDEHGDLPGLLPHVTRQCRCCGTVQ